MNIARITGATYKVVFQRLFVDLSYEDLKSLKAEAERIALAQRRGWHASGK